MIISVVGATGNLGSELLALCLQRNHQIRAIAPDASRRINDPRIACFDATDADKQAIATAFQGSDAIAILFAPNLAHPETYSDEIRNILNSAREASVKRIVGIVGSSGAITSSGAYLVDTDYFQETTRHFYQNVHACWDVYRNETDLDWVAVVPAARMQIHLKSHGRYRFRTDEKLVVTNEDSMQYFDVSQISYGDCALALLDEIELHRHSKAFVCVGY